MKKIDDLLFEIYTGDDYSEDNISEDKILKSVIKKIKSENEVKQMKNKKIKTMLIAACITAAIGITTVFAGQHININLIKFFGFSQEQQEEITQGIQTPECSASQNGVNVNIIQTLSDGRNIYVVYEVVIPETMSFDNKMNFEKEICDSNVGIYTCMLEQDKNRRVMMKHLNFNEMIDERKIHFNFKNLQSNGKTIIDGEWDLKWDYNKDKTTEIKTVYPDIIVNSKDNDSKQFMIKKVTISPFSVLIDCINKESKVPADNVLRTDVTLYFDDGATLSTKKLKARSERGFMDGIGKANFYFEEYLDINSLEKMKIGNTIIELK